MFVLFIFSVSYCAFAGSQKRIFLLTYLLDGSFTMMLGRSGAPGFNAQDDVR